MIEAVDIDPRPGAMARFAPQGRAICFFGRHTILEFALVRIGMAGGARAVLKVERQNLVCSSAKASLMAIRTGNCDVCSGQHKVCFLVFGDGECAAVEVLDRVTIVTSVLVRSGGELLVVLIFMAIRTRGKFHFILRFFPGRRMAFITRNSCMLAVERVFRCRVFLYSE